MNDLTKRFIETYKALGLTGYKMNKECSVITKQKISNIENGITDVTSEILSDFFIHYGNNVNANYILTGDGEMLKGDIEPTGKTPEPVNANYRLIPIVHIDSVGGLHSNNAITDEPQYIEGYVPFVNAREGDRAIYESGNSMIPTIPPGSLIQIRKVENWREYFGYGNIYVIELTDGRQVTKEVAKYEPDPKNYILCKSHNPDVADEELPRDMIASVWKVINILINKGW